MIFIISSSFGERLKLKASFTSNDNMMTGPVVYYIATRGLPTAMFAFWLFQFSLDSLWHILGSFSLTDTHQSKVTKGWCSQWPRKDPYNLRAERPSNVIGSNAPLNKWVVVSIALTKGHPFLVWSPPVSKNYRISDAMFAFVTRKLFPGKGLDTVGMTSALQKRCRTVSTWYTRTVSVLALQHLGRVSSS